MIFHRMHLLLEVRRLYSDRCWHTPWKQSPGFPWMLISLHSSNLKPDVLLTATFCPTRQSLASMSACSIAVVLFSVLSKCGNATPHKALMSTSAYHTQISMPVLPAGLPPAMSAIWPAVQHANPELHACPTHMCQCPSCLQRPTDPDVGKFGDVTSVRPAKHFSMPANTHRDLCLSCLQRDTRAVCHQRGRRSEEAAEHGGGGPGGAGRCP